MMALTISTQKEDQIIDITDRVQEEIRKKNVDDGVCHLFLAHTTCALTTADLDPGTDQDMIDALRNLLPNIQYRHPHNPEHTPDHILSSIIGSSINVPIKDGELVLGTWQRIILVEFDGPRERKIIVSVLKG